MEHGAAFELKARLHEDLIAMKAKRGYEVSLIRSLLALIDNSEAAPLPNKGGRDRKAVLSPSLLETLRQYWRES